MSEAGRIALQPGYVLHRKPYRETSLLLEVFTADYGRLGLVARGTRRSRHNPQALLQPFVPLHLSWSGRGELVTLTAVEPRGPALPPTGRALFAAYYVNELLLRLLTRHDPHEDVFASYELALRCLSQGEDEWCLRLFEKALLQELGYGLILEHDIDNGTAIQPQSIYCYHVQRGPTVMESTDGLSVHGATLLALADEERPDATGLTEAKRLMRAALAPHLGNRPLRSREVFRQSYINPTAHAAPANEEEDQ